jgi:hypothetical protein
MSLRLSSVGCLATATVLAALFAWTTRAADQRRGRAIEFSELRSAEAITNLNQLSTKRNGLKQLEEDLYKPLQSFAPKTSLDGFFDPPEQPRAPSQLQSRRAKEQLDRQRNWVFLDPDEKAAGLSPEEIFHMPEFDADGQEKKKLSVFERYLANQDRKRADKAKTDKSNTGRNKSEDFFGSGEESDSRDDAGAWDDKSTDGAGNRDRGVKKPFGNDIGGSAPLIGHGTFTDIFGLGEKAASAEDAAKHKAYMDEFRSLLNSGWKTTGETLSSPGGLPEAAKSSFSPVGAWDSLPGSKSRETPSSFSGSVPSFSSSPSRSSGFDSSFRNSTPAPAPAATTKVAPPIPTFTAPRRSF